MVGHALVSWPHRSLLAVEQLREQVRELVERRLPAGLLVCAHRGQRRRQQQYAFTRHEPFPPGKRLRPVDVGLGVPLPFLAALIEVTQLLDFAAVIPGPVQIQRHIDIDLAADAADLLLVNEVDGVEVTKSSPVIGKNPVHHPCGVQDLVPGRDFDCRWLGHRPTVQSIIAINCANCQCCG
jgi:hypothetical protein